MTNEEAFRYLNRKIEDFNYEIKVVKDYTAGKNVQLRNLDSDQEWVDCKKPLWNFNTTEYRLNLI